MILCFTLISVHIFNSRGSAVGETDQMHVLVSIHPGRQLDTEIGHI